MSHPWSFSRLELRAPLTVTGGSLARVELLHRERGRITDIGRGKGPLDSILMAVGRIVGIEADVRSIGLNYRAGPGSEPNVAVDIVLRICGADHAGHGVSGDLLTSCIAAYLDAATDSAENARAPC